MVVTDKNNTRKHENIEDKSRKQAKCVRERHGNSEQRDRPALLLRSAHTTHTTRII